MSRRRRRRWVGGAETAVGRAESFSESESERRWKLRLPGFDVGFCEGLEGLGSAGLEVFWDGVPCFGAADWSLVLVWE